MPKFHIGAKARNTTDKAKKQKDDTKSGKLPAALLKKALPKMRGR